MSDSPRDWARPVVHFEIEAVDAAAQRAFYSALFSWDIPEDGFVLDIPIGIGGPEPGPAGHIRQGDKSAISLYIQVGDIDATLERAVALGATKLSDPFQFEGTPTMAQIADPEGNGLMLIQQ